MGLHLTENRKAETLIQIQDFPARAFHDPRIFPLLGFVFGELAGDRIAAVEGVPQHVSIDNLIRPGGNFSRLKYDKKKGINQSSFQHCYVENL